VRTDFSITISSLISWIFGSPSNSSIEMGDDSGDKRGRGRPRKQDVGGSDVSDSLEDKKSGRGRPRKAAEAASAAVKDQSNRDDDNGEPKAKRGRGRPKGSTGKRKKKGRVSPKKRGKSAKAASGGDTGGEDFGAD